MRGVEEGPALPAHSVVIFGSCEQSCYSAAMGGEFERYCMCVYFRTQWKQSGRLAFVWSERLACEEEHLQL